MIGDHLYTTNPAEIASAVANWGYQAEPAAPPCYVFAGPTMGAKPFHRLNSPKGDHFYTTSDVERNNAITTLRYTNEGEACYVFDTVGNAPASLTPLYRLLANRNGDHFYTTSAAERTAAKRNLGYHDEIVACYVLSAPLAGTVPLLRAVNVSDPVRVQPPALQMRAQLVFVNVWLETATGQTQRPAPNEPFAVRFSFLNVGNARTGPFVIRMIFTNRGTGATFSNDISAPSFDPGTGTTADEIFNAGLPTGDYIVDAYLDVLNAVPEQDEAFALHHSSYGFII